MEKIIKRIGGAFDKAFDNTKNPLPLFGLVLLSIMLGGTIILGSIFLIGTIFGFHALWIVPLALLFLYWRNGYFDLDEEDDT